jgi:hypothetical protein
MSWGFERTGGKTAGVTTRKRVDTETGVEIENYF